MNRSGFTTERIWLPGRARRLAVSSRSGAARINNPFIFLGFALVAWALLGCTPENANDTPADTAASVRPGEAQQALGSPVCITIQRAGSSGAVADTQISSDPTKINSNFGANLTLVTGLLGLGAQQALLQFDLSAIPAGATVNSADLTLHGTLALLGQVRVHRITAPWSESAVTFKNFNSAFASAVDASFSSGLGPLSFSVKALAQAWVSGASPNHGILLEQDALLNINTGFNSSEAALLSLRPKLVICYTPNPCAGVVCAAADQCHLAGTCDPATGQCSNPPAPNGAVCNDGNACTQTDACQGGVCIGGSPVTCVAADACHVAGACNPATGQCSSPAVADGTACDDSNAATEYDTCQAGVCSGADSVVVTIQSPTQGTVSGADTVQVTGSLSEPATVTIGTVNAAMSGLSFSAVVPLHEGNNIIAVEAKGASGRPGSASTIVIHDTTPPRVVITAPANNAVVAGNTATVTGTVQDLLIGTVNPGDCAVTVNGVPATVQNRGFRAEGVPIAEGAGTITAVATDLAGNTASAVISVTGDMTSNAMIFAAGGDGQSGVVGAALAQPFTAFVADNTGTAMPGFPVTFKVTRGNGVLPNGARSETILSDAQGFASTTLTLGSTAGAASDQVVATAPAFLGAATFAANAAVAPLGARVLTAASGGNQKGVVSALATQPLGVLLADDRGNPFTGQSITFTVLQGGGRVDGASTITRTTDTDGRAYVLLTLGPAPGEGSQLVRATTAGAGAVHFVASTLSAGPSADTKVSGVVLMNENIPINNVKVSVKGTNISALTDAEGRFSLPGAPVGPIHLEVDGTTAGPYPTLSFDLDLISGADNTMDRPIYLPLVDSDGMGTANPTTDIVLRRADTPGLVLSIPAGSATFNGISKTGTVQVIRVHRDKIPMLPSDGALPSMAFAIMPHAAHFDPPAPIRFPNVDGRQPGEIVQIYSYDHDLGAFVVVGTATVSEDGQEVASEPGQGIVKGGWHYAPPVPTAEGCVGANRCNVLSCTGSTRATVTCSWARQSGGAVLTQVITQTLSSVELGNLEAFLASQAPPQTPWSPDADCFNTATTGCAPSNATQTNGACPSTAVPGRACTRRYNGDDNDPMLDPAINPAGPAGTCVAPTFDGNTSVMCCPTALFCLQPLAANCPTAPGESVCCQSPCRNSTDTGPGQCCL